MKKMKNKNLSLEKGLTGTNTTLFSSSFWLVSWSRSGNEYIAHINRKIAQQSLEILKHTHIGGRTIPEQNFSLQMWNYTF